MVYSVVLAAGLYYALAGISPGTNPVRLIGFVAVMVLLFAVERWGTWHLAWWLAARLVLYVGAAALDESGLSRALFLVLPFVAYLRLGRVAGWVTGGGCLVAMVGGYFVWVPRWYVTASYLADVLMFAIGTVLALMMAAVAVGATQAQQTVAEMTAQMERARLARDIHDSLGHHLTAVVVQLEMATTFRGRDPVKADKSVADAYESARRALAEVRTAVQVVRAQDHFDLPKALRQLADDTATALTVEGTATGSAQVLTTLFRAAQESVTNAKRHADASTVQMRLTFTDRAARLDVTDDGRGFDPDSRTVGFGLLGMRERAELVGGRLEVHSQPGTGTRVTVTVPT